jgi:hypothetical protein
MNRSKDLDTIAPDDPIVSSKNTKENNQQKGPSKQKIYDILGHTKSSLSSLLINPSEFNFSERNSDEEIYLTIRSHWITNLHWIITAIIMLFIPLFLRYVNFLDFLPSQYRFFLFLFWYLFIFVFVFEKFLDWYFDLFLVTNQRLVDIDFNNLLNRHFAEAEISMIQDLSFSIKGFLGTFFNYGDVLIQTAAKSNQINFEKVPNPRKIVELIEQLRKTEEDQGGNRV